MKKSILILVLLLSTSFSKAQTNIFHPYDENMVEWYYESMVYSGSVNYYYAHLGWGGDTNILGQDYIVTNNGAIRQDIAAQKLFYIDENNQEFDITINQFLAVGDTLFFTPHMDVATRMDLLDFFSLDSFAIVQEIDSIEINGDYRTKYIFHYQNDMQAPEIHLAVGIGVISATGFEHAISLICYSTDNNLHYGSDLNPLSTNCTAALNELDRISFKVYPNPAQDFIQIQYEENNQLIDRAFITDLNGKKLIEIETQNLSKEIAISDLENGIYLICIESSGLRTQEKFVKLY